MNLNELIFILFLYNIYALQYLFICQKNNVLFKE